MKNICIFVLTGIFMVIMPGCHHKTKHVGNDNSFVWYEIKNDGLMGAIDQNDNELLPSLFKTIELVNDYSNGNSSQDYEWQLRWNATDNKNHKLVITLYVFEDGWRYYYVNDDTRKHRFIAIQDYSNVILDFPNTDDRTWIETTYCRKGTAWWFTMYAPSLYKLRYFYVRTSSGDGLYRDDGTPIIPVSRGYNMIWAYEQNNRAWYKCDNVICESNGKELFRYNSDGCQVVTDVLSYAYSYDWLYNNLPADIKNNNWFQGSENLAYDPNKGFISVYMNEADDAYCDYRVHYTGIKLSSSSSSFDVEPSRDNEPTKEINLRTYTYSAGGQRPIDVYQNYYPNSYPTYDNESFDYLDKEEVIPSHTKHWHNVRREEDCRHCFGSGKCSSCNGKGWEYNEYGLGGTHDCPNCTNGDCPYCHGTGKIIKIEQVYD